jgi:NCS1 family nucleobase:cation symporter-1
MIPFFSTGLFSGWVANAAKGADYSLFVGLPVSGILYWVLSRNIDVDAEERLALEQADTLEQEADRHERPTV